MNPLATYLDNLELGEEQVYRNIAIIPLVGRDSGLEHLVMRDAMDKGLDVTETKSVSNLHVINRTGIDVLFIPGECVKGGMQDRMMSITGYLSAGFEGTVPVKCVEAGRWNFAAQPESPRGLIDNPADRFIRGEHEGDILNEFARRAGNQQETHKREPEARFYASGHIASNSIRSRQDQRGAWDSISSLHTLCGVNSPTSNYMEVFRQRGSRINEYLENFVFPEGANGFIVVQDINGKRQFGLELFDSSHICRHYFSSLLESYCVDGMDRGDDIRPEKLSIDPFFSDVKEAGASRRETIDKGTYMEVRSPDVKGSLLHLDGTPIYMNVLDNAHGNDSGGGPGNRRSRHPPGLDYGGFNPRRFFIGPGSDRYRRNDSMSDLYHVWLGNGPDFTYRSDE